MVEATEFNNGEKEVSVSSVRVHETTTGYAESFQEDLEWFDFGLNDIEFSDGIKAEWKDPTMYDKLVSWWNLGPEGTLKPKLFVNDVVEKQV